MWMVFNPFNIGRLASRCAVYALARHLASCACCKAAGVDLYWMKCNWWWRVPILLGPQMALEFTAGRPAPQRWRNRFTKRNLAGPRRRGLNLLVVAVGKPGIVFARVGLNLALLWWM